MPCYSVGKALALCQAEFRKVRGFRDAARSSSGARSRGRGGGRGKRGAIATSSRGCLEHRDAERRAERGEWRAGRGGRVQGSTRIRDAGRISFVTWGVSVHWGAAGREQGAGAGCGWQAVPAGLPVSCCRKTPGAARAAPTWPPSRSQSARCWSCWRPGSASGGRGCGRGGRGARMGQGQGGAGLSRRCCAVPPTHARTHTHTHTTRARRTPAR